MDGFWESLTQKRDKIFANFSKKKDTQLNTGVEQKKQGSVKTELGENKMKISKEGIALIKKFEGCELEAYQDSVGVWTIGYGHTKDVEQGLKITQEEAEAMLETELLEYEGYVEALVDIGLSQNQFDALVCWTYNLGPTNLKNSTMLTVLNQARIEDVPYEMKRWNKAGGEVLQGLVRRREAEALLFEGKEWYHV